MRYIGFWLVMVSVFFVGPDLAGAEKPPVLAWGDLRGHVMPCGCDPLTDMGGIARIGRGLERWRALRPLLITVDLGQNTDEVGGDLLKSQTIVRVPAAENSKEVLVVEPLTGTGGLTS